MKEYKYKINGNLYKVTVGDIEENNVRVEVNGTPYTVELEKHVSPKIKPVVRTASTTPAAPPPAVTRPTVLQGKSGIKSHQGKGRRHGETRTDPADTGSHENGKRHQVGPRRQSDCHQREQRRIYS